VRPVAPSIERGLRRFIVDEVGATQNAASPTPSWGDEIVALVHAMKDRCAECGLVEGQRLAGTLDPQLGLDARHRGSSPKYEHPAVSDATATTPHAGARLLARLGGRHGMISLTTTMSGEPEPVEAEQGPA
jgi:hypothetical protein